MRLKIPETKKKVPLHTVGDALAVLSAHGLYVSGVSYSGVIKANQYPDLSIEMRFTFSPGTDVGNVVAELHAYGGLPAGKKHW